MPESRRYPTPEEKYGLTSEQVQKIRNRPRCDVCGRTWAEVSAAYRKRHNRPSEKRPDNIDHCHSCNQVRGLLCTRCNYWVVGVLEQGQTRPRVNLRLQARARSYIRNGCECHWRRRLLEWAKKRLFLGWNGWQLLGAALMFGAGAGLAAVAGYQTAALIALALLAVGKMALLFTGERKHRTRGADIAYGAFRAVMWCVILAVAASAVMVAIIGVTLVALAMILGGEKRKRRSSRRRSSGGARTRRRRAPRRYY